MFKKVTRIFIFIFSVIMLLSSSLFTVYADNEGDYFYVPTDSALAYTFFMNYGLTYNNSYVNIGNSTTTNNAYYETHNAYYVTQNYSRFNFTNTSSTVQQVYFIDSEGHQVTSPSDYVPQHVVSIPQTTSTEGNTLRSYLNFAELSGTIINPTGYNTSQRVQLKGNSTVVISWISFQSQTQNTTFYSSTSNNDFTSTAKVTQVLGNNKAYKYIYTLTSNINTTQWITPRFYFSSNDVSLIPLYVGDTSELTDELAQQLGISTTTETLLTQNNLIMNNIYNALISADSQTQQTISNNNNMTNDFNSADDSWHDIESGSIDNMDLQLQNIGTNNDLYNNGGFLNAVNFISATFMKFINDDPSNSIGLIITFSLILGLSLTILGKLRN